MFKYHKEEVANLGTSKQLGKAPWRAGPVSKGGRQSIGYQSGVLARVSTQPAAYLMRGKELCK